MDTSKTMQQLLEQSHLTIQEMSDLLGVARNNFYLWKKGKSVPKRATVIKLSNISIATSGDYRNYRDFDGRRYSHIISPKTGYPVENKIISVSVISKECLNADALATALMVMDVEDGINLVEKLDGYESFFILEDNSTRYSSGIKDFLN